MHLKGIKREKHHMPVKNHAFCPSEHTQPQQQFFTIFGKIQEKLLYF